MTSWRDPPPCPEMDTGTEWRAWKNRKKYQQILPSLDVLLTVGNQIEVIIGGHCIPHTQAASVITYIIINEYQHLLLHDYIVRSIITYRDTQPRCGYNSMTHSLPSLSRWREADAMLTCSHPSQARWALSHDGYGAFNTHISRASIMSPSAVISS